MKNIFLLLLCAIFLIAACSKKSNDTATKTHRDGYIARVGDQFITVNDISEHLAAIPDNARNLYEGKKGLRTLIDELIKTDLLYLQAKKEGLDRNAVYISRVESFKKFALVNLLFEKIIASQADVSENEARDYYEKNIKSFTLPQQIRASHILVKTRTEAEKILGDIRKGKNFGIIARQRSIDTNSAENGGDLGFFVKGEMSPEFEAVEFRMKKGEISQPVKSRYGYHIIKLTDIKKGKAVEFSRIKDTIIKKLKEGKQQDIFNKYIGRIRDSYPVKINETAITELLRTYQKNKSLK